MHDIINLELETLAFIYVSVNELFAITKSFCGLVLSNRITTGNYINFQKNSV